MSMTETLADYRRAVRARHRAAAIDRIVDCIADGQLTELPDVFLIIIESALARDLSSICEFSRAPRAPRAHRLPTPPETAP